MSGLDKMKTQILKEAEQSAQEILDRAKGEADSVLEKAREEAGKEAAEIRAKACREAEDYAGRAKSASDMRRKQAILSAKQDAIREVLGKAYDKVMDLGDEQYFDLLEKLLERYALPEDGVICFSEKDLKRMPEGFSGKIKTIAAAKGGSLALSDEPKETDGGFLLVYGGIEENCTIKAVFDSKREELSDKVNRMLFG